MTDLGVQDWAGFENLIKGMEKDLGDVIGDGAYDRLPCCKLATTKAFKLIVPPQRNARTSEERKKKISKAKRVFLQGRDETVKKVREIGQTEWKKEVGYHRRSLVETAMFRIKTILGSRLSARTFDNQKVETAIWCKIINHMTKLGIPISYVIG